jgi:catalase
MHKIFAAAAVTLATTAQAQSLPSPGAADLVDALNGTFGSHAGKRASHAKGFCAVGEFVPARRAGDFAHSPLFAEKSVPATVRFSVGGGNPAASDKSRSVRGMSMRLAGGGETYDLLLISEPVFFAATPESFVSFLQARKADPATGKPDPARIAAHNARFPDGTRQPALLAAHAAPASYATTPYFSNNAFQFESRQGGRQPARIIFEPQAATRYLDAEGEKNLPDLFLQEELEKRLAGAPVGFTMVAQLPAPGDSLTDPSVAWQGAGRVELGQLTIKALAPQSLCDDMVFMPVALPASISPSDDPILLSRAAAYAISKARRSN